MDLFHDRDVELAEANDGKTCIGNWTLRLPRIFGFCGGVLRALTQVHAIVGRQPSGAVHLLGEIIHNDTVNDFFKAKGVNILPENGLNRIYACAAPGDTIVIPAFGIPKQLDERLRGSLGERCTVVDTTCPYVRRVWTFVESMSAEGRTIVVHAKPDHPETLATLSRALTPRNGVLLVPDGATAVTLTDCIRAGSLAAMPAGLIRNRSRVDLSRLAIANQTTMLCGETQRIAGLIREAVRATSGGEVPANTVCSATQERQEAASELCLAGCDLILVVGGFSSSNTNQLYRLAADHCTAYFISDPGAITPSAIRHYVPKLVRQRITETWLRPDMRTIGLLAGASCPPTDIGGVIRRFRSMTPGT